MKLVRELPISMWRDELADERPFLDAVDAFQVSYFRFRSNALKYDGVLSQLS